MSCSATTSVINTTNTNGSSQSPSMSIQDIGDKLRSIEANQITLIAMKMEAILKADAPTFDTDQHRISLVQNAPFSKKITKDLERGNNSEIAKGNRLEFSYEELVEDSVRQAVGPIQMPLRVAIQRGIATLQQLTSFPKYKICLQLDLEKTKSSSELAFMIRTTKNGSKPVRFLLKDLDQAH